MRLWGSSLMNSWRLSSPDRGDWNIMNVARLCSSLVKIQSENPPGNTEEAIYYIHDFLESLGVRGTITKNPGGRCNLVVNNPANDLLLCGHVDVVPALSEGWSVDPYSGIEKEGYIWGRGATDMKGGCASILSAIKAHIDSGGEPNVNLAFVCDEETGGEFGIRYLISKGLLSGTDCLIAEPTPPLNPCNGQKGLCRLLLKFSGEPGHGSLYPHMGVSAIMEAFSLLEYLNILNSREFHPSGEMAEILETSSEVLQDIYGISGIRDALRKITYNPGKIEGGEKANIIAQQCRLELDMRVPWGCSVEKLLADIAAQAPRASITPQNIAAPSYTSRESRIVQVTCSEIEHVYGTKGRPIVQWAASDARYLRKAGFNAVEYGPGEILTLHGIDERVSIKNLENVTKIYIRIINSFSTQ
jgi:succinyl-diaminopimelate desuccinylase